MTNANEDLTRLGTKETAIRIRADIKAAKANGTLPKDLKVSVVKESYSGGSSINVRITEVPEGTVVANVEEMAAYLREDRNHDTNDGGPYVAKHYTAIVREWLSTLESIVLVYHRDQSDRMNDYFHVNFYYTVELESDLRGAVSAAIYEVRTQVRAERLATPAAAPKPVKASNAQADFLGWLDA